MTCFPKKLFESGKSKALVIATRAFSLNVASKGQMHSTTNPDTTKTQTPAHRAAEHVILRDFRPQDSTPAHPRAGYSTSASSNALVDGF